MRRLALPALLVLLSGCGEVTPPLDLPFGLGNTAVHRPAIDGYTMRRVVGQPEDIAPLEVEPGNVWPSAETGPRRSIFDEEPEARRPPPARRGSSTPPPADAADAGPGADLRIPAQPGRPATPPARPEAGRPLDIPGAPGSTVTGGTDGYQTFQTPGGGQGLTVPGPGGTMTIIGPDGSVRTVPRQ